MIGKGERGGKARAGHSNDRSVRGLNAEDAEYAERIQKVSS
jgi:hypothetical protein